MLGNKIPASCELKIVFSMLLGEQMGDLQNVEKERLGAKNLLFNIFGTRLFVPKFYIDFRHCSLHMQ